MHDTDPEPNLFSSFTEHAALSGRYWTLRCAVMSLLLWTACTDPQFAPLRQEREDGVDASVPDQAEGEGEGGDGTERGMPEAGALSQPDGEREHDAGKGPGPQPEEDGGMGAVPAWAEPMFGRYAVRAVTFGEGSGVITRAVELSLVTIARTREGAELRSQLCAYSGENDLAILELMAPQAYPELRRAMSFEGRSWSTDGRPLGIGYAREVPAECRGRGAASIPRRPEQSWLGATCRCPADEVTAPLADDCRVGDPDRDGMPGLAYRLHFKVARVLKPIVHGVFSERSHFVHGGLSDEGVPSADVRSDYVTYQLACEPEGLCGDISKSGKPCRAGYNHALFARLGPDRESWSCADLVAASTALFADESAKQPTACSTDTVTEDPNR